MTILTVASWGYNSYALSGNLLYAITAKGQLLIWDLDNMRLVDSLARKRNENNPFTAIASDKYGNIYLGTEMGSVIKSNHASTKGSFVMSFTKRAPRPVEVYRIILNSQNEMIVITSRGFYDVNKKTYVKKFLHPYHDRWICRSSPFGSRLPKLAKPDKQYFLWPNFTYVDSLDCLWMCRGRDVQLYDTRKHEVIRSAPYVLGRQCRNIGSIFSDDKGHTYLTSRWGEADTSAIYRFEGDSLHRIFYSRDHAADTTYGNILVGAGAYNKHDSCIYFASSDCIWKAMIGQDGKLTNLRRALNYGHMFHYYGSGTKPSIPFDRIEFISQNRLLMTAQNGSIWIYDGQRIVILR